MGRPNRTALVRRPEPDPMDLLTRPPEQRPQPPPAAQPADDTAGQPAGEQAPDRAADRTAGQAAEATGEQAAGEQPAETGSGAEPAVSKRRGSGGGRRAPAGERRRPIARPDLAGLKPRRLEPGIPCYTYLSPELDARLDRFATEAGVTKRSVIEAALDAYLP